MKKLIILLILLPNFGFSQAYKDKISIVQYSATFVKEKELSLSEFEKDYQTHIFYMGKDDKKFESDKIQYVPTIVVYHNGNEHFRIDGGIKLALPENSKKLIRQKIEEIIESKF